MRLFLSSYGFGNHADRLLGLTGKGQIKALVITNASDLYDEAGIVERYEQERLMFKSMGIDAERLDLREYFNKSKELSKRLRDIDLLWVRGGNSFVLLRAIRQSGCDVLIKKLLASDSIVYGGYSAGACILAPTMRGIDMVDDPISVPDDYDATIPWEGLGIINYSLAPHYKSDHPESHMIDRTVDYFVDNKIPHKAMRDGEVIVINGESEEYLI